jgi:hypothetical protein
MPANGLSASTSDRSEQAECNAPPFWVVVARHLLRRRLSWRLWAAAGREDGAYLDVIRNDPAARTAARPFSSQPFGPGPVSRFSALLARPV